ncbi:coiled-coil domain-containing protein 83-like isoform X1 [Mytilus edulis]|uniref:coiled-coil domain-containing protein 83-like isoform X1 n=1 Tax=Mytilus edulis TaxID=6550 RepID=UPI0039EFF64E
MGKKKGGKKKGGKKGKKGGKKKEVQMTAKEAILAYQIGIVEKKLEDQMYEIRGWEDKIKRNEERNAKLKADQKLLINEMLKTAKVLEEKWDTEEMRKREDVVVVMKDYWEWQRQQEEEIEAIKKKIEGAEKQIDTEDKNLTYWTDYKDRGQNDHKQQIMLLTKEMEDMENSFSEMIRHLETSNTKDKSKIKNFTEEKLISQKTEAKDKAIGQLDKYSRQEILDKEWLHREVEIHKREAEELRQVVENLEKDNLEIMSELFECKIEDLKVSRNFYLTQFDDDENLEEDGVLEMDMKQLSINQAKTGEHEFIHENNAGERIDTTVGKARARPMSATQRAIEDRVFSIVTKQNIDSDESDVESVETDLLDNMYFEEEDFGDYLKLGPLELKLLNVTGTQMPIHVPEALTEEESDAKKCKPDEWPVTAPMLKSIQT